VNKLPGYVLPLLPFLAALIGVRMASVSHLRWWLVAVSLCLIAYPWIGDVLPRAMVEGLSRVQPAGNYWIVLLPAALLGWQVWRLDTDGRRVHAVAVIILFTAACIVYLKATVLPRVDSAASARSVWRRVGPVRNYVCLEEDVGRSWVYGLNYYSVTPLPPCSGQPVRLTPGPTGRPIIVESEIIR
jgi:hypothetical protein